MGPNFLMLFHFSYLPSFLVSSHISRPSHRIEKTTVGPLVPVGSPIVLVPVPSDILPFSPLMVLVPVHPIFCHPPRSWSWCLSPRYSAILHAHSPAACPPDILPFSPGDLYLQPGRLLKRSSLYTKRHGITSRNLHIHRR
jgi:hypothetical protein